MTAVIAAAVTAAGWPRPDKYHFPDGSPIPLKSEKQRLMHPDSPDEALRWRLLFERDEGGNIPVDGLMNARRQADAMRARDAAARARLSAAGVEPPPVAGISNGGWTWVGPGNIGGRTRAVAINPSNASIIFLGGVAGGIWKSTNAGASFNVVDDFMGNLAITEILFNPADLNMMFASTGEGFANIDAIRGAGIFKSTNGGTTWTQLPATANANFSFVNEMAISPDGGVLLAATQNGMFRSTDLGASWSNTLSAINMMDVKFIPGSSSLAVGAGANRNPVYSIDGGTTWLPAIGMTSGSGHHVELAVSPSSPGIVYASIEDGNGQVWKSLDFGVSYAQVSTPNHLGTQGWYDNAIWVDPTNVSTVVIGGVDLYRSVDGGLNFTRISNWQIAPASAHADHHAIVSDPGFNGTSNKRVYFGNDGGLYRADDVYAPPDGSPTIPFTVLNNNYGVTQFYGAAGHRATGRIFGGTQDNGTKMFTPALGPQAWTSLAGGDGGFATADQTNALFYGEFQWGDVHRSTNGAASSRITGCFVSGHPAPLLDAVGTNCNQTANFIAPILLDPNDSDRLLAGGANLWLSTNPRDPNVNAVLWSNIKPAAGSNISAIAVAKGNSDVIWIGHSGPDGRVYVTVNGTSPAPAWTRVDDNGVALPNRAVSSIQVDPNDPATAYVSLGGFSTANVWVTHDNGVSWTSASGSGAGALPAAPVRWIVPHPSVPGWLYAATDVGLFASVDGGASWHLPQDGPANVAVFQVFFMGNTLVAVTHGRGIYTADVTAPNTPPTIATQPVSQTIGPGQNATLTVVAAGTPPLGYQWYQGSSPNTATPIGGATSSSFTTPALVNTTNYWVRVSNGVLPNADSTTATITVDQSFAGYNSTLKVPKCANTVSSCDSGPALLLGRASLGPEPNQPNTINNSCADGTSGVLHVDESMDRLKVSTLDGLPFAPGKTVKIDATVWADTQGFFASDRLDLYFAADATNPSWTFIATLSPGTSGSQTLSNNYVLPAGTLQAVRAVFRLGGSASPCGTNSGFDDHDDIVFAVNQPNGIEVIQNGNFNNGMSNWNVFEVPDIVHNSGAGGVFKYHRANPTTTGSGQAVVFQDTGVPIDPGTGLTATFDIGNTDSVRKRMSVLVIDSDFSDISVCTFWLAPNVPLRTYQMRTHPTRGIARVAMYLYAASAQPLGSTGDYLLDNVSLKTDATSSLTRTECIEPVGVRPNPPGGAGGPNLLVNGDFGTGSFAPWGPFNDVQAQIAGGVFEFYRPGTPGQPAGGVLQATGQAMTQGQIMTSTFQLGNSSGVRKRVTVLLHALDFSDLSACTFWLAPGLPLSDFAMRSYATKAWTNATLSIYGGTAGPERWIRLDNVSFNRTPGASQALGTECFEPGSVPAAPPIEERANSPLALPMGASSSAWTSSGGFASTSNAVSGAPWMAEAWTTGPSVLTWTQPIDLRTATSAHLQFSSWLSSRASSGHVQVSLDGETWEKVANVPATTGWSSIDVDLSAFAGQRVYLRFVFEMVAPYPGAIHDFWLFDGAEILTLPTTSRLPNP